MKEAEISFVIPAYNEAKRLPETLERIQACFAGVAGDMALGEVIVVDDGSRDGTIAVAENFTGRLPMRVIALPTNRGKGAAVRTGMLAAAGDRVLFYDADGATPPEEILRLGAAMNSSGADVAIVTPIAGTTRDKVTETIQINGIPINVIDTAGMREAEHEIEREGVRRAEAATEQALSKHRSSSGGGGAVTPLNLSRFQHMQ